MILALKSVLGRTGMYIAQPYDWKKGRRVTMNPAYFLRALGPETLERSFCGALSRRPNRRQYGENPNRLQHYFQYRSFSNLPADNVQEIYSGKLGRLGIINPLKQ